MRNFATAIAFLVTVTAAAAEPVTIDTFVRAETDTALRVMHDRIGFGNFFHIRAPTPLDDQPVIRMNRNTLYSASVLDLSEPVTVTLPDTGALGAAEPASAQANVEECGTDLPLSGTTSGGGQSMVYRSAEHRMGPLGVVVFDPPGDHIAGVLGAVDVPCSL